jgi:ferritin-like protein
MDFQYRVYVKAEDIAIERYGTGFYDLTEEVQDSVWEEAESIVMDELVDRAERMREEMEIQR